MILISRLLNGSLCICVLRLSVFHVVKWYLIFPDFVPFREPFMTKKPVQRRILTVVRPRSLDSVVIEAAGEFGRRLFKPQSFPRIGWGCSDAYRTGMTTQYVSVPMQCLPSVWKAWNLELSCWGGVFLNCFIYYHSQLRPSGPPLLAPALRGFDILK